MRVRSWVGPLVLAVAAASGMPATAAPATGATPSRYGTTRGFQLVGHTTLANRGENSPIAVAGKCVYVGDRYAHFGVAIVDVSNPRKPRQVGKIPPVSGATQREMRADAGLGVLVVMSYSLSGVGSTKGNDFKIYDISKDCTKPRLASTYDFGARSPHEFFLWKDRAHPGRALLYTTMTIYAPDLQVIDITDIAAPKLVAVYDSATDGVVKPLDAFNSDGGYLHSISVSDDGTRAYMGTWDYGFYVADTSTLAQGLPGGAVVPRGAPLMYDGNVHGAVKVPGKNFAVLVDEGYAGVVDPYLGTGGCPFGWLHMADISNEALPTLTGGEYKLPENDCDRAKALNGTFTSHNQTVFPNIVLMAYYGGGLRAVDISNPAAPREAGVFVPKPTFEPDVRDTRLYFGGNKAPQWTGAMWSYPVVQNGLIYVVDIDLGLYILRYTGPRAAEVARAPFVEGNSAPSRYTAKDPVIRRPRSLVLSAPTYVRDRYADAPLPKGLRLGGFFCVT
ncbi:MAG: LVIVD repeat-containing protein [Mycobacteriales bacterium]|nr:hypothetical protein [Frankia sp.]